MTELKTLKDIFTEYYKDLPSENFKDELKAEAIKWVKKMKRDEKHYRPAIVGFKDFFNITGEDLK